MRVLILALALSLTACTLTPRQRTVLKVVAAGSVVAIVAAQGEHGQPHKVALPADPCSNPESCR